MARAALALVDAGGLESLTMRRLATALDSQLPTIYRLFDGKGALMDEMANLVLAGVLDRLPHHWTGKAARPANATSPPAATGPITPGWPDEMDWADRITALFNTVRQVLLAQRDGARIVGGSYATKSHTQTHLLAETGLEILATAGFPPDTALRACTTLFSYTLGEVLEQQGTAGNEPETMNSTVDTGAYPHLTAASVDVFLDFDARFAFGVGVVVAGVRGELGKV
ncbi:Tetracyclin repressor domain-containing protein [Actinobacteria bacterium OK074]|nr:Tetracyclin repressor domain-containing protein [Actinobacteria bacterium OK074]